MLIFSDQVRFLFANNQTWPIRPQHLGTSALMMEILFDLRHTARCCSRLFTLWNDFSASSAQTAPPASWSTDESGRETASTPENLPAAAFSWELGVSRDSVSSYSSLETSGQASCRLWFFFFCSAFFWCICTLQDKFRSEKFWISCHFVYNVLGV